MGGANTKGEYVPPGSIAPSSPTVSLNRPTGTAAVPLLLSAASPQPAQPQRSYGGVGEHLQNEAAVASVGKPNLKSAYEYQPPTIPPSSKATVLCTSTQPTVIKPAS
jgi:hypothetical protein